MGCKFLSSLLTLIRSTSHRPLPQPLFKRLLQTQKNLHHLEILPSGAIDEHYDSNTEYNCMPIIDILRCASLEKLQSVRVVPDVPQTAALCSIALQKGNSQVVTSLEVDARHWVDAAHFAHAEDSMATKDQLVESLFAHLPRASPGHNGPFDNLTTLVLRDVKLAVSKYTWFTYLSLSKLQRLELRHCKDADIFLLQLISGPEVPALKAFTMVHDVGEHTHDRSILGIEQLLQDTGNGIVELELCLRNAPKLPKVTSIIRHGGSLRRLTLDIGSSMGSWHITSGRLVYDEDKFQDLLVPRSLSGVRPTPATRNRSTRGQPRVQHTTRQISRVRPLCHKRRDFIQARSSQSAQSPLRLQMHSAERLLRCQRHGPTSPGRRYLRDPLLTLGHTPDHCVRHPRARGQPPGSPFLRSLRGQSQEQNLRRRCPSLVHRPSERWFDERRPRLREEGLQRCIA